MSLKDQSRERASFPPPPSAVLVNWPAWWPLEKNIQRECPSSQAIFQTRPKWKKVLLSPMNIHGSCSGVDFVSSLCPSNILVPLRTKPWLSLDTLRLNPSLFWVRSVSWQATQAFQQQNTKVMCPCRFSQIWNSAHSPGALSQSLLEPLWLNLPQNS